MNEPEVPLLSRALTALRVLLGWTQERLALAVGVDPSTIRRLENGKITLTRERLEEFAKLMEAKPGQVEEAIAFAATQSADWCREPGDAASDPRVVVAEKALAAVIAELRAEFESARRDADLAAAKEDAAKRWQMLAPLNRENRRLVVEDCWAFQTPALCRRLCDESERAAARSATDAVGLAQLAFRVVDFLLQPEVQQRAEGYACAFVANSHRVANELGTARLSIDRCRERFPYGSGDEMGLFPESRVLDLEASLRRDEGEFGEALSLLDRALAICEPGDRVRVLLKKADTFELAGEPEKSLAASAEALPGITLAEDGPRLHWLLRFNEVKILLALDRPREAATALPDLRRLGTERGDRLSFLRLRWLEASVSAALGGVKEALVELAAVRRTFAGISFPADAAIVGLHEAEILLRAGQTGRVRELVAEMQPIFASLQLKLQALAAVRLFVEAAGRDAATVEMARAAAKALCRAPRHG